MQTLFSIPPLLPAGFHYIPGFISGREEQHLVDLIRQYTLHPMMFQGFEAKRKVHSFGYNYHFSTKTLSPGLPIPLQFQPILQNVADRLGMPLHQFAALLLTQYDPGTVINWHRDAPPFEKIAGLSLLSDCTFKLRPYDKSQQTRAAVRSFTVERRSLYLMESEARSDWEHSIAPVKSLRYSITMRTLRPGFSADTAP